jgi:metal-responsive CopG/Arc/MetJ family transcriptional regulator
MKIKAHLVLPRDILEEVDQIAGKRSLFIAEATREKLQREQFLKTLEETQGAWNDKNHPELKTARDMEQFISDKRQSYRFHQLPPIES